MLEIPLDFPPDADLRRVTRVIENACAEAGLTLTLKDTLKQYPGCRHWHYKRGAQRGTLEITLWPAERRAWFKVSSARSGDWIKPATTRLQRVLTAEFKQQP